jgi:hypothetical protein
MFVILGIMFDTYNEAAAVRVIILVGWHLLIPELGVEFGS